MPLDLIVLDSKVGGNGCECGVCGAKGKLEIDAESKIEAVFAEDSDTSVVTWKGKENHMAEIERAGKLLRPKMEMVKERKEDFDKIVWQG